MSSANDLDELAKAIERQWVKLPPAPSRAMKAGPRTDEIQNKIEELEKELVKLRSLLSGTSPKARKLCEQPLRMMTPVERLMRSAMSDLAARMRTNMEMMQREVAYHAPECNGCPHAKGRVTVRDNIVSDVHEIYMGLECDSAPVCAKGRVGTITMANGKVIEIESGRPVPETGSASPGFRPETPTLIGPADKPATEADQAW